MERTALVLSGGGLRGGAHIGVLKVFEQVGLLKDVSVVAGASAGSIISAMLASGATVDTIEKAVVAVRTMPCDDLLDINTGGLRRAACTGKLGQFNGLIGGQTVARIVDENLVYIHRFADYAALPPETQDKVKDLFIVAVNLDDGLKTVFCDSSRYPTYDQGVICGRLGLADAVLASCSEPGMVTPFSCSAGEGCACGHLPEGTAPTPQTFIDGAVRDSCPLRLVVDLAGCTRALVVNLGYAGDRIDGVATQGIVEIISQSITIMATQHFDADVHHLRTQLAGGDIALSAHVINPRLFDMGAFDFDRLPEAIQRGMDAAEAWLDEVDERLHIFGDDGKVDPERLFSEQGVFTYNYPDPQRAERRARLIASRARPTRPAIKPCHFDEEVTRLALLALAAVVSLSMALFTLGGIAALRLKPNAASAGDVFVFWDGGLVAFLAGWVLLFLFFRFVLCRRWSTTRKPTQ